MANINFFNQLKQIGRENLEAWMQSVEETIVRLVQEGIDGIKLPDLLANGIPNSTSTVEGQNFHNLVDYHFYHAVNCYAGPLEALNQQSAFLFVICDRESEDPRSVMQYAISAENGKHYVRHGLLSDLSANNLPWVDIQETLKGDQGPAGPAGQNGTNGKSAYELWLAQGNTGTLQDYFATLKGDTGESAYEVWKSLGNTGTVFDFLASLAGQQGPDGKDAYELWLEIPENTGKTFEEFLLGFKGDKGDTPNYQLEVGTVTTAPAGTPATAEIVGTGPTQTINFTIPQGAKGEAGEAGGGGGVEVINSPTPTNLRGSPYWGKDCKGLIFGLLRDTPNMWPNDGASTYQLRSYRQNSPATIAYEQLPAVYEMTHYVFEIAPGANYEVQITKLFGFAGGVTPIYRIAMLAHGETEVKYGPWQDSSAYKVPSLRELLTNYAGTAICPALWGASAKSGHVFRHNYWSPSVYYVYLPSASSLVPYGVTLEELQTLSPPIYSTACAKPNGANQIITMDLKLLFAFTPELLNNDNDFNNKSFIIGVASGVKGHAVVEYHEDYNATGSPKLFYEYFDAVNGITKVELPLTETMPLAVGLNFLEIAYETYYTSVDDVYSASFRITLYSKDKPSGYDIFSLGFDPSNITGLMITPAFPREALSIDKLLCGYCLWFAEFPAGYPPELRENNFYTKLRGITNHAYGLDYDTQTINFQFP